MPWFKSELYFKLEYKWTCLCQWISWRSPYTFGYVILLFFVMFLENFPNNYPGENEYTHGEPADKKVEVFSDVKTTFFLILAIYFPAVTGIFTGTNMSGDLKNPQKSIPGGTIAAQLTTSFIYLSLALVFGFTITPEVLRDKYGQSLSGGMVVASLAWPSPWVLLIGSFLSTFGAALQCLCSKFSNNYNF